MTGEQKSIAELVEAARKLEASAPTLRAVVLGEVRSAGYAVRIAMDGGRDTSTVYRFMAPRGIDRGPMVTVGMMAVRRDTITYAEFGGHVFPQWAGWTDDERDASIRGLLHTIRDAKR